MLFSSRSSNVGRWESKRGLTVEGGIEGEGHLRGEIEGMRRGEKRRIEVEGFGFYLLMRPELISVA